MSQRNLHFTDELVLPLDIITMRQAEYGDSGSGKTAYARLLAEKVYDAKHRFCAIDLKNDWWGLKSSADGAKEGIPVVIFGGPKGDVKLVVPDKPRGGGSGGRGGDGDDEGARIIAYSVADTVTSIDQSVIIDLDALSRIKQERFLAPFLDRLYEANREPLLLFCDECDRYAPQKPMTHEAIMSLSSSEDIARRGRKRGIGSTWLTQRTAVLNKNVSEFANLVVVFRTPGSKDLAELEDRVGRIASKDVVKEVVKLAPGLEDGQAFFLSSHPKLRQYMPDPVRPIQLPLPRTFDSSATPRVGQRRRDPKVLAQADLAAIESKMAEQVQRAKDNDPAELKRQVVDLRRQLEQERRTKPTTPAAAEKIREKRVEIAVLKDGQLKRVESIANRFVDIIAKAQDLATAAKDVAGPIVAAVNSTKAPPPPAAAARPATSPRFTTPAPARPARTAAVHAGGGSEKSDNGSIDAPTRKILYSLAWWNAIDVDNPTVNQAAAVAGYAPSGTFDTYLSRAGKAGLLVRESSALRFTEEGLKHAPTVEAPGSLSELHGMIVATLDGPQTRIVRALIDAGGGPMALEDLAAASNYAASGTFDTYLSRLGKRGLIDRSRNVISATDTLFPPAFLAAKDPRRLDD